ncbi:MULTISPECIES: recombinase zinc beta ribbon domain-containing protein [unclassified Mesorhizobium]|uniref:zinc ribbon domain-containing protein n=1 Tax=unclassified Mesorhizobium TaxID=325217 RepID=UPI001FDF503F|nr:MULTISPECIES: recombinase zinc beta ribbon domain-containing protein [unclassified Mesorhizobium]
MSDHVPTSRHHGAPKHGDALLADLVRCRRCGRELTVRYTGTKHNIPRYSCWRGLLDNGEPRCIAFGGLASIEGVHPLPDGPWVFSRSTLDEPAAQRIVHRARQNPKYPMGSHPDQQNLFTQMT